MAKKTKKRIVERHKILLKTVSDNIRNGMSMEQAMIKVGYTKSYAKTSTRLKETDSWKKLVDEKLSDEKLTKVHEGLLRSEEHTSELQSHSFISYAVFCLKKKNKNK